MSVPDKSEEKNIKFVLCNSDWKHILPLCKLIVRVNALSTEKSITPQNIYGQKQEALSCEILDSNSYDIGRFMIKTYAPQQGCFGLSDNDTAAVSNIAGPGHLVKKAIAGKGVTMRRVRTRGKRLSATTSKEEDESKRQAHVKKGMKVLDCMSSSMNTCQSLVNPNGTKASVQKSTGVRKALMKVLSSIFSDVKPTGLEQTIDDEGIITTGAEISSKQWEPKK
ncbi:hypothetical protein DPMN_107868 [Dreissena polymorpha]|uniref:Uncharacterized protein n=1 Tax=Dreissena polymorpha TaxID=45954 RepID=A0A9D4QKK5_DREPO|nr:hypothetical protein DPMN_107868 [Dreissena polymorpha]